MGVCGGPKIPQIDKIQMCLDKGNLLSHVLGSEWKDVSDNGKHMYAADGSGLSNSTSVNANDFVGQSWMPGLVNQVGGWSGHSGSAATAVSNELGITESSGYTIHLIRANTAASPSNSAAFKVYRSGSGGSPSRAIFAHVLWSNGGVYFDTNGSTSPNVNGGRVQETSNNHSQNDWQHWTFTKDGASAGSNVQTIYKEGAQLAQRTNAGPIGASNYTTDPILLGYSDAYAGLTTEYYGYFAIWNTCLTATEVKRLYHCIAGNSYDNPSGRWVQP